MCGIVGIVNHDDRGAEPATLDRMCDAIRHRGPDDAGARVCGAAGLAMRRLSIIDLDGGHQPLANEDERLWIVFNGEIYNHRELRAELEERGHAFRTRTDTEAIVHGYEEWGERVVERLRGMFAFAIWDTERRELFAARDRVGKKPFLYAETPRALVFGSEFRALLRHPEVSREIDPEAIDEYLSFMCVPAPRTAYRQIRKLEPGHALRFRPGGSVVTRRYWQPDFHNKLKISEEEAAERTLELLRDAVRVRLMSEVPLGAFLSGGIDSSAVVALMSRESSAPVKTFSIGFEEQDFSELEHARRVAEHVGADHHEFVVRPDAVEILPTLVEHYGEPYADSSAVPTYYVARETRRHVTVALNGDGGDELFAGYERYAAMRMAEDYRRLPGALRRLLIEPAVALLPAPDRRRSRVGDAQRFLSAASRPAAERYALWVCVFSEEEKRELYADEFRRRVSGERASALLESWFARADGAGVVDAALLADTMTYLPNDLLVKVDIATMAVSLEARSPFLDHHLIEFAASLPAEMKLRGRTTKHLLKRAVAELLPPEILGRRKMGFGVPVGAWLRGEMKDFARGVLLSEKAQKRGVVDHAATKRLLDQHARGESDHAHRLWTLLMLELWFDRFIDSGAER